MSAWPEDPQGRALFDRLHAWVDEGASRESAEVDALAAELFAWQRVRNEVLERVARAFVGGAEVRRADDVPAVPTDVFKVARVACFEPSRDARVFQTSGTTRDARGRHAFADTALYAKACVATAATHLLPRPRYRCVFLAQSEDDAPDSSLSFMLARFAERWDRPGARAFFVRGAVLDGPGVIAAVRDAAGEGVPVAMLGTTYAFVHVADALTARGERLTLPPHSVVMPTGGTKGRSREITDDALNALLQSCLGVTRAQIVGEYGMTELSSQAWEVAPGRYRAPPWMIVSAVEPESLARRAHGEVGLLRAHDLLNLGSAAAVLTADLCVTHDDGTFSVLGRAPGATPRGCARAMDALLLGGA